MHATRTAEAPRGRRKGEDRGQSRKELPELEDRGVQKRWEEQVRQREQTGQPLGWAPRLYPLQDGQGAEEKGELFAESGAEVAADQV